MADEIYGNDLTRLIDEDKKFESFILELKEKKCCNNKFKPFIISLTTVVVFLLLIFTTLVIVQHVRLSPPDASIANDNNAIQPGNTTERLKISSTKSKYGSTTTPVSSTPSTSPSRSKPTVSTTIVSTSPSGTNTNIPSSTGTPQPSSTQRTQEETSARILASMDGTGAPCEDFYQFACGGWMKSHQIPSGSIETHAMDVLRNENNDVLRKTLDVPFSQEPGDAVNKAKMFYASCIDKNGKIESLGAKPMLDLIRSLGGWSVSSSAGYWNANEWDFQTTLEKVHSFGLTTFFNLVVEADLQDPTKNTLQFSKGSVLLKDVNYRGKSNSDPQNFVAAYRKYMIDCGVLLGGERERTEELMLNVLLFEAEILQLSDSSRVKRSIEDDLSRFNWTIGRLQPIAPFIDWKKYVNNMLAQSQRSVSDDEPIWVFDIIYSMKLSTLVESKLQTREGRETVHNYLMWQVIEQMNKFMSKPFRDARQEFYKVLLGITGSEERWMTCATNTDAVLGISVGAMFVQETFRGESKTSAETMIDRIKRSFVINVETLNWMDNNTKQAVIDKVNAVKDFIGFPEFILNRTTLDAFYNKLQISDNEFFMNNYRSFIFNKIGNFDKLHRRVDTNSWDMTPSTVNAYYSRPKNEMVFPAGILQAPFYHKSFPKSLNYGGMGVVMGHELTHGFDNGGRLYDKYGAMRSWWPESVAQLFQQKAKCVADQYSEYSVNGEKLNGTSTLGENIADNGGLKSAFHAYEEFARIKGEEVQMPGLNFTHRQLFFIAFAQAWCQNINDQGKHLSIQLDEHSLNKYRVIGAVSNSKDFAKHFQCPVGAPMNPTKKCQVW